MQNSESNNTENENGDNTIKPFEATIEDNSKNNTNNMSQEQKNLAFQKVYDALAKLESLKKTLGKRKHRGKNPGAFGSNGTKRKLKKKLHRRK